MATAPGATIQAADAAALAVKRLYYSVPIVLGAADNIGFVAVRGDVADYFNIPVTVTGVGMKEVVRDNATGVINRYGGGLLDTTPYEVTTEAIHRFYMPPLVSVKGGGRAIILKTELATPRGTIRSVTLRFPVKAILAVISDWLFTNIKVKSPGKFSTKNGTTYLIVSKGTIGNLNPGSTTTPSGT